MDIVYVLFLKNEGQTIKQIPKVQLISKVLYLLELMPQLYEENIVSVCPWIYLISRDMCVPLCHFAYDDNKFGGTESIGYPGYIIDINVNIWKVKRNDIGLLQW